MTTRSRAAASHSDMVTIIYPPGCREITEDLGSDELIRRLKTLAHHFQTLSQAEDESTYADFIPLAIHLADEHYLSNSSRDVQLLVACCIADILRIFAPEAPYKDPMQIKTIFFFLIKQLGGLKDPKDPAFKRYFYLLENLAYVKSFNMCFDLEESNEIFCALFQLMFKIVNDEHSGKVKSFMLDVLTPLITESDFLSNELLDIILINIVEPLKTQRKNAYMLAKDLIIKTSDTLQPYIQQFFNQVLILGKSDQNLQIAGKVYALIYELNHICPKILMTVLPQLEFKLKSTEDSERMGSVSLLASMFSERGSTLAQNHRQLWQAFLGRYNDISVSIRTKCVQYTMHFLLNHPELIDDITEALRLRTHDPDENVRYQVVIAIVSAAKKDFDVVARSEDFLTFVKERTLDKKFKIRKEAMSGLAHIYKKYLEMAPNVPEATKGAVTWMKDKILHGYYMAGMEDRLLVERLVNKCLVPFELDPKERMKKLLLLYATVDDNASKAFAEIQKNQYLVRKSVTEFIALHRLEQSEKRDTDIKQHIHVVAKHLPEPVKATEFIRKLSGHMLSDKNMLSLMESVVDPDLSCADCLDYVKQLLKKLGAPVMSNLYHGIVKQLMERISSVMVDKEAITHLVDLVHEALEGGAILQELELESTEAGEKGLRLLLVLAYVFPSHFFSQEIIKELITILSIKAGDFVVPLTLSVLSFVGKHKALSEMFPELMNVLVPICKSFISHGNAKQAKHAVKCLYMNTTSTQDVVFAEVLEIIKGNLEPEKGEKYLTAIVALGHVAYHLPDKFPVHVKNLVSRKIVKELLMQDRSEARLQDMAWVDEDELPLETRCKIEGMKMMARWLVGLKDDKDDDASNSVTISAQKTFRMLTAIISNRGDLLEEGKPSAAEKAWLRLTAGCAMLKICEQKGVGDKYALNQFYTLAGLCVDEQPEVRERFLKKLHKGLGRGIPYKCLPLDFMGLFALYGLEEDKSIRNRAKAVLTLDINKRKDFVKSLLLSGANDNVSQQIDRILPDFLLVYAIPILNHVSGFEKFDDVDMLKKLQNALWFVMEPLITKNENFSFGFYKALLEQMKCHKDRKDPDDDTTNYKLWALCDLAMSILITKTTNYELKEFPSAITMPNCFYKSHEDPNFVNAVNYLPSEFLPKKAKKTGIVTQYFEQPRAAQNPPKRKDEPETVANATTEEKMDPDVGEPRVELDISSSEGDAQGNGIQAAENDQTEGQSTEEKASTGMTTRKRGRNTKQSPPVTAKSQHSEAAKPAKKPKTTEPEVETIASGRPRRATRK